MMMEVGRTEAEEQEELRRQIHNFENDPSVHNLLLIFHNFSFNLCTVFHQSELELSALVYFHIHPLLTPT